MNLDNDCFVSVACARLLDFQRLVADIPYERKGIPNSEMFFLWLCATTAAPPRILESGRARGQSTLILARIFPNSEIVSVEHDPGSPDVQVAAERLKNESNVRLLFGDATRLLPELAQAGDVALIDGPKGFRGIRLAMELLATGMLPMVFVHDTGPQTAERRFIDKNIPRAYCSDQPDLVAVSHVLDDEDAIEIPHGHRFSATAGETGYGYGLSCLPFEPMTSYRRLRLLAAMDPIISWFNMGG